MLKEEKRKYPDKGLVTPKGEYKSSLVELVREIFGPPPKK